MMDNQDIHKCKEAIKSKKASENWRYMTARIAKDEDSICA